MENLSKLTNDELIKGIDIIAQNHEKIKHEILTMHELLSNIEQQYVELTNELISRKV